MKRRLVKLLSVLSLLLCITMSAMWHRSNAKDFWFHASLADTSYVMKVRGGLVSFYRAAGYPRPPAAIAEFWIYYPILLAAFAAYFLFLRAHRPRHKDSKYCEVCGYDLRATPGRCPECGTVPKASEGKV